MRSAIKEKMKRNVVNTIGIVLLAVSAALFIWSLLLIPGTIQARYAELQNYLYEFQLAVASLDRKWLIVLIIELLFVLKSIIPIPVSLMFVLSGMVFPYSAAVLVNAVGMLLLVSVKYLWGYRFGTGKLDKKLLGYPVVQRILNLNYGKGITLLLARLIPWCPINKISQLYGAMKYPFDRYLYISVIAISPKVLMYSVIGRNVYDPFSTKFLAPLTVLFAVAGSSLLLLNALFGKNEQTEANRVGTAEK